MAALTLAMGAISMVSQISAGRTAEAAHEYSAQVALNKAAFEAERSEKRTKYLLGRQRMLYGAAGVALDVGSPFEFMQQTAAEGWKEAEMVRRGGRAEAQKERIYGRAAYQKGMLGGISSFLSGAATAYGQYKEYGSIW